MLLFACGSLAPGRAATAADPWQAYLDAAVEATAADDFAGAEALLKAAGDVAKEKDPGGARQNLTQLMVDFTEIDLGNKHDDDILGRRAAPDLASADRALLPAVTSFARLAAGYYSRWKALSAGKESDESHRQETLRLKEAELCRLVELALQRKLLPADDVRMAGTIAWYGIILDKEDRLAEARESYRAALKLWAAADSKNAQLMEGSRRFSLNHGRAASIGQGDDDPLTVKSNLAWLDMKSGYRHCQSGDEQAAKPDFKEAEDLLLDVIATYDKDWPDRLTTGFRYLDLAILYRLQEGRLKEAEAKFRRALAIYEAVEGEESEEVASIAKDLADVLRDESEEGGKTVEIRTCRVKRPADKEKK